MKSQVKTSKKMIRVEWYDHTICNDWIKYSDADEWCAKKPILCVTVGWLWYEDSENLVVALSMGPAYVSELQKIIKNNIVHRRILK